MENLELLKGQLARWLASETVLVSASLAMRVVANVFLFYFIALFISPQEFGEIMLFFTMATLLACFIEYGSSTLILASAGEDRRGLFRMFGAVISARIYLTVLSFLIYVTVLLAWSKTTIDPSGISFLSKVFIFLSCALFINAQTAEITMRAIGRSGKELQLAVTGNGIYVLTTISCLLLVRKADFIPGAMLIGRAAHLLNSSVQLNWERKKEALDTPLKDTYSSNDVLKYLSKQRHFAIQVVAATAYLQIDSVLLGLFVKPQLVGLYQLFFRMVLGLGIIADAAASTRLRRLSVDMQKKISSRFVRIVDRNSILLSWMTALMAVIGSSALVVLIKHGVVLKGIWKVEATFYGTLGLVSLSLIMVTLVVVRFWTTQLGAALTADGLQRVRAVGALTSLVCVCVLCGALIPMLGILGAALSNLSSNILLMMIYIKALNSGKRNDNSHYKSAYE